MAELSSTVLKHKISPDQKGLSKPGISCVEWKVKLRYYCSSYDKRWEEIAEESFNSRFINDIYGARQTETCHPGRTKAFTVFTVLNFLLGRSSNPYLQWRRRSCRMETLHHSLCSVYTYLSIRRTFFSVWCWIILFYTHTWLQLSEPDSI
jgi:hypothetical protein